MGTKDDVQKLWDTLSQPNKYAGTGIKLDRDSIRPVEGTEFPLWEAKAETDKMPERDDQFKNLYADFSALSICLNIPSEDGKVAAWWYGADGHCDESQIYKNTKRADEEAEDWKSIYDSWKTLKYVPETVIKTPALCLEAVKHNGEALEFVPDELKTREIGIEAITQVLSRPNFNENPLSLLSVLSFYKLTSDRRAELDKNIDYISSEIQEFIENDE
jgi:hypothetical protein